MIAKLVLSTILVGLGVNFVNSPLLGQELSTQKIGQLLSWRPDKTFSEEIRKKFSDPNLRDQLDFDRLSSMVPIPAAKGANLTLDMLAKDAVIGGLYLSSGSTRLNLPPGAYRVNVRRDPAGTWKVDHYDSTGKIAATVNARVNLAERIDGVVSYADYSVCYQADSWVVCY